MKIFCLPENTFYYAKVKGNIYLLKNDRHMKLLLKNGRKI